MTPAEDGLGELEIARIDCGEVRLECRLAGPRDAALVVLLHGFPESWISWRHQIAALAPRFRVVAPNLRGYGESDRPRGVEAYRLRRLVGDVRGLVRALGRERAHIVGHDWGGGIAWALAIEQGDVCERLAVLNCPHPAVFRRALQTNPRQMLRSWYILFFQLPWLPEHLLAAGDLRALDRAFSRIVRSNGAVAVPPDVLEQMKAALRPPGAIEAALHYYRAAFRYAGDLRELDRPIRCPTLLIWGERDFALGRELTVGMEALFAGPFRREYVPDAGHWVQQEAPLEVNRALLGFLAGEV